MPRFYVEEHAIDRYIERVSFRPREEVRAYFEEEGPRGAKLRTRTRAGDAQVRLPDCVLVVKPYHNGLAVVTVLGENEVEDLAPEPDLDNEDTLRNAIADASRHVPLVQPSRTKEAVPSLARLTYDPIPVYVDPTSLEECTTRRAALALLHQQLQTHLGQRPKPPDSKDAAYDFALVGEHLRRLRAWRERHVHRARRDRQRAVEDAQKYGFTLPPEPQPPSAAPMSRHPGGDPVSQLKAKLEKERVRHIAHAERMDAEKRKIREALRIAIQHLVRLGDEEALAAIATQEPGFLKPEFYNLRRA